MTFLILHGIHGHAGKHWMQWLHDELVRQGHQVIMPTLPNATNPDHLEWRRAITELLSDIDHNQLIVVGHSMGVPAALDYLQANNKSLLGLISVAGFSRDYGSELNTNYMQHLSLDMTQLQLKIAHKIVIYGDDDPYVSQTELALLAEQLGVHPVILPAAGHINTDKGYTELPQLLPLLSPILSA